MKNLQQGVSSYFHPHIIRTSKFDLIYRLRSMVLSGRANWASNSRHVTSVFGGIPLSNRVQYVHGGPNASAKAPDCLHGTHTHTHTHHAHNKHTNNLIHGYVFCMRSYASICRITNTETLLLLLLPPLLFQEVGLEVAGCLAFQVFSFSSFSFCYRLPLNYLFSLCNTVFRKQITKA